MAMFIDCVQTGAQTHTPSRAIDEPEMKAWRCDLTALSQVHNLYFVACNDTIRVYQPNFPDQTFAFEPSFVLHPPVSSPHLAPYMDDDDPHSITRVLVAYLGNEEVLLVSCDDGDVVGYRVGDVWRAVTTSTSEGEETHVRTFLHRNVGKSAWGLAVHREARMIAISANTHEITVLAYALAGGDDFSDEMHDKHFPAPRTRDHVITLKANHNVPAVSFNNTAEDREGRWLFSTCINGEVRLWDLHHPDEPARIYEMGFCLSVQMSDRAPRTRLLECRCDNWRSFPHGTWGAMWLDENAAYEIEEEDDVREDVDGASFFEDAEKQKERFRDEKMVSYNEMMTEDSTNDEDSEMQLSDYDSDSDSEGVGEPPELDDERMSLDSHTNSVGNEASQGSDESDEADEDSTSNPPHNDLHRPTSSLHANAGL